MKEVIERLSSKNKNAVLKHVKKVKKVNKANKIKTLARQPADSAPESG